MADVIVLTENTIGSGQTLRALQEDVSTDFYTPNALSEKRFHCFCRKPGLDLSEIHSDERISIRKLKIGFHKILLVLVHGVDIRNYGPEERQSFAQRLAQDISFFKKDKNISKLIVLGDFNMNPYEKGMTLAAGLNAMMARSCVSPGVRRYLGEDYEFYYNPMWSLFGDNTPGPPGTIYNTSNQGAYGWSMLDQVLIHHSIVDMFDNVQIMTQAGDLSLMTARGRPDSTNASDHFPILVSLRG